MSTKEVTPEVLWAQRSSSSEPEKNVIYLTISVPDVPASSMKIDLKPTSLTFTGYSETKKATYHVELEFYGEIDVENTKKNLTPRDVEFVLRKKELKEEYWPRLLKESKKVHFLKTDFDKWVDEDEQNEKPDDSDYMNNMGGGMGGMPGMGDMGGMGGMGGDGGFGGIDFSKLGGGAGMPDLGDMGDMNMPAGAGGDDSDDDMPELEDEEAGGDKKTSATDKVADEDVIGVPGSKDTPKIEEVS